MKKLLLIIIIIIIVNGCTTIPKLDEVAKKELLQNHLKSWENLRISGIIEVNDKAFSFRKNILIRKNKEAMRIDIFDTGIMGLKPQPFLTAYYDSTLTVKSSLEIGDIEIPPIFQIFNFSEYEKEILNKKEIKFSDYKIFFSNDYKIERLEFSEKYHINFEYGKKLQKLEIFKKNKNIIIIQVDEISHQKVELKKM